MPYPNGYFVRSARASAASAPACAGSPAVAERRALLEKIGAFIVRHDLAVTPQNLATICGGLTGTQPEVAALLAEREASGEPVDQRWLDTLARFDPEGHSRIAALDTLSDKLEFALMRFAQAARAAQSETSDHRDAIGVHLEAMNAPEGFVQVLDLSRVMLARLEQVEAAMARSEAETELLRDSLAKARIEADVDHLTRLPNRRAFERRLVASALDAKRRGEPLSLAFCDVDHFKQINDRHGHAAGDRVLCALAAALAEGAGQAGYVARHGGEEFVLLFHGLAKEAARGRLDAVRRAQCARVLMNRETGQPFGKITFSAGIAEVTENADIRSALARADAALYRAKQQGRNRVELG
jgi:diguanylate cyclase